MDSDLFCPAEAEIGSRGWVVSTVTSHSGFDRKICTLQSIMVVETFWGNCDVLLCPDSSDVNNRRSVNYVWSKTSNVTHRMFASKVCQRLCNLHAISIAEPTGPEVTRRERLNMSVNRITAHIQRSRWMYSLEGFFNWKGHIVLGRTWGQFMSFTYKLFMVSYLLAWILLTGSNKTRKKGGKKAVRRRTICFWTLDS